MGCARANREKESCGSGILRQMFLSWCLFTDRETEVGTRTAQGYTEALANWRNLRAPCFHLGASSGQGAGRRGRLPVSLKANTCTWEVRGSNWGLEVRRTGGQSPQQWLVPRGWGCCGIRLAPQEMIPDLAQNEEGTHASCLQPSAPASLFLFFICYSWSVYSSCPGSSHSHPLCLCLCLLSV